MLVQPALPVRLGQFVGVTLGTKFFLAACAALVLSVASTAEATPITINPNDFPFGTDLSAIFSGVTLSHLTNDPNSDGVAGREVFRPVAAPVYAIPTNHTGSNLSIGGFGLEVSDYGACRDAGATGLAFGGCSDYDVLDATFHSPTGFLEIKSIFFSDGPSILAYDQAGNRITFGAGEYVATNTPLAANNSVASTIVVRRAQSDIAKIVFGGVEGNATPVEMTYKVAEPTTMGLMLLGVAGAAAFRRRRT